MTVFALRDGLQTSGLGLGNTGLAEMVLPTPSMRAMAHGYVRAMRPGDAAPATGDDAPVGATEVAVAERVADRVDGAVDITQPVT